MTPADHDAALALTSHLPHAVASALAASVPPETLRLAAGAYRDATRVAGADAALWTAIFRDNRGPLLDAIGKFQDQLSALEIRPACADDGDAHPRSLGHRAGTPPRSSTVRNPSPKER